MNTIENQIAYDNATINNAEQINNNIFDNPLKFFCDKKASENPNLKSYFQVIHYTINKDNLKIRFGGANYKYDELVNLLEKSISENAYTAPDLLDDGYKSVINCIVKTVICFNLKKNDNYLWTNSDCLYAEITNAGLKLRYSEKVITYEVYQETKIEAEKIIRELAPYLNCATQYGNFFQFNNIYLEEIKNVPFLTEEVKFHVSNEIIPNLIKPLYGESPECGLREIIQNACDASKELEGTGSPLDAKVEVHLFEDSKMKKIRVRDYGIGMTKDILLNKYFAIGESSKKDSNLNLVGQFGIGALAAFLLGDTVEVRTKHNVEEKVYHFSYTLNSNKDRNINISIKQDSDFGHGTEVTININEQLSELSEEKLKDKLKLDEWYVLPDVSIEYYVDLHKQDIRTLKGDEYSWIKLDTPIKTLEVNYLDESNDSQVILNGLIVPEKYEFPCKYLKNNPYISIKSYGNTVKLNLERSRIESGLAPILEILQEHLIKVGLDKLVDEKDSIVSSNRIINRFSYDNKYFKNIPLFFCKEGFGIYSKNAISKIREYNTIVRVYGYNGYPKINLKDLTDNVLYLFYDYTLQKSNIADLVESYGSTYIPNEIIKKYFYFATSQHTGFRFDTMKKLYCSLVSEEPLVTKVSDFWQEHNRIKENRFKNFFDESMDIIVGSDSSEIIDGIKNICKSAIISISDSNHNSNDIIYDNMDIGIINI